MTGRMKKITKTEIESLLDFIEPQKGIPVESAMAMAEIQKGKLRAQLQNQKIYPDMLPQLKKMIIDQCMHSKIESGESVGVIAAQSIGEKTDPIYTQQCRLDREDLVRE